MSKAGRDQRVGKLEAAYARYRLTPRMLTSEALPRLKRAARRCDCLGKSSRVALIQKAYWS